MFMLTISPPSDCTVGWRSAQQHHDQESMWPANTFPPKDPDFWCHYSGYTNEDRNAYNWEGKYIYSKLHSIHKLRFLDSELRTVWEDGRYIKGNPAGSYSLYYLYSMGYDDVQVPESIFRSCENLLGFFYRSWLLQTDSLDGSTNCNISYCDGVDRFCVDFQTAPKQVLQSLSKRHRAGLLREE
ncbi:hypothetical protein BJ508DRAFT_311431 [Ascobolus immersus RN42]|uniref:Uncharacterized protein n=1 Tax=Ascobolus immersus RN42 TaxID=1160509 RepID=A0A3N4HQA8_ASCIM|nr:hypothetical protein BJ508DRAFT_311431 [Ascobolus immersus RN42]